MKRGILGRTLIGVAAVCMVMAAVVAAPKGKDPLVGNWDLDVGKSTWVGRPGFKSGHLSVTATKEGVKAVVDLVPASGNPLHYEYLLNSEGTDTPVTGNTYFDSVTMIRTDKHTTIRTERRGGKVVGMTTIEMAKDGKSFTGTTKGTLPDGHQFSATALWNRAKK